MFEFWVTENAYTATFGTANDQMRLLNEASRDGWEFVAVNAQGRYIFRKPRRRDPMLRAV